MVSLVALLAYTVIGSPPSLATDLSPYINGALRSNPTGPVTIDLKGGTYEIRSSLLVHDRADLTLKNGTIIDRTPKDKTTIAALGFVDCPGLEIVDIKFKGTTNTGIGINSSDGATVRKLIMTDDKVGSAILLQVTASDGVTIEDSRFDAKHASQELVKISNGHPWHKKGPEHYFHGGQNLAAFIGDREPKISVGKGTDRLDIRFDPKVVKNSDHDYKKNTWLAFWPGKDPRTKVTLEKIDLQRGTGTLRLSGEGRPVFPEGALVSWYTYWGPGMAKDVTIRRSSFNGSKGASGLTLYWIDGFLIEDSTARNNKDYGIGVEWSKNGRLQGNSASNNQGGWNQFELVFYSENITTNNNDGVVGIVAWGSPVIGVDIQLPTGQKQAATYHKAWRSHQWQSTDWTEGSERIFGWFEKVRVGGEAYQPKYFFVPERLLRLKYGG